MKYLKEYDAFIYDEFYTQDNSKKQKADDNDEDDKDVSLSVSIDFEGPADDKDQTEYKLDEKARPPRLKQKDRDANKVKAAVSKKVLGPDGPFTAVIQKIFKTMQKEVIKTAKEMGVPPARVKLDKITIRK